MEKLPKVSFIIPTYNGKKLVKRCLNAILSQKYPRKNIEIIAVDGGSIDGTLELLKKYPVKIINNKKRFPEGKGMGKSQGVKAANKEIIGFACKLKVEKRDNITNRYLSLVGTDPFAIYRSIEGRMALNKINLKDEGNYFTYIIKTENCLCTGGNCFIIRKKLLNEIHGYTQDVEMIYELASRGKNKLAIPKNAYTHHLTINNYLEFLKKRNFWAMHQRSKNLEGRKYSWEPKTFREYKTFLSFFIKAITIIPNFIISLKCYIKTKESAWLLHAPSVFLITLIYAKVGFQGMFKKTL